MELAQRSFKEQDIPRVKRGVTSENVSAPENNPLLAEIGIIQSESAKETPSIEIDGEVSDFEVAVENRGDPDYDFEEMETADEVPLSVQENQGAAVQSESKIPESNAPTSMPILQVETPPEKFPADAEKYSAATLQDVQENQGVVVQSESEIAESNAPTSTSILQVETPLEKVQEDAEKYSAATLTDIQENQDVKQLFC